MYHLKNYIKLIPETLPEEIIKKYHFISRAEAIEKLHFPLSKYDFELARERLAYDELFEINYTSISRKKEKQNRSEWKSISIPMNTELIKEIISKLPFELTSHQKISLFQVLKDMEKNHSMQRLLQWDVGTGKTIIATIAIIHSVLETQKINQKIQTLPSLDHSQILPSPLAPLPKREEDIMYEQKKYNPAYIVELSKKLRQKQTESEEILWEVLRNRKFHDLKFRRQYPIWRYIADFYCEEIKLVIELDWKIHENKKEYDEIRNDIMKNHSMQVLRFKNEIIYEDITQILNSIIPYIPLPLGEVRWGQEKINQKIQTCFMAPTEILARQHFQWLQNIFLSYWLHSQLLVGSTTKKEKNAIKESLKLWNIDVIIWTHALIEDDVIFHKLWLVIIDEQHRFWVKQREVLEKYASQWIFPHSLNMTATPIPRTLALTLYWDQDLSIINEYPVGRKNIFTKVAKNDAERNQIELFVRNQLESWRQIFWISPLVEESEKIDLANAVNTFESLTDIFSPFTVWLLHGKMKPKEKQEIMKQFENNEIQILSSTSVVEVWVNIPNASIMCIEWAERFWLSQLHQFRGRVGRWAYQSYCYLFPTHGTATDRLKAMEKTNNGFELSEIDLELRGPGEVYGVRQSWVPEFKIADIKDLELVSQIREDIEELFDKKLDK